MHIKGHTVELVPGKESGSSTKSNSSIILVVEVVEVPVELVPGKESGSSTKSISSIITTSSSSRSS